MMRVCKVLTIFTSTKFKSLAIVQIQQKYRISWSQAQTWQTTIQSIGIPSRASPELDMIYKSLLQMESIAECRLQVQVGQRVQQVKTSTCIIHKRVFSHREVRRVIGDIVSSRFCVGECFQHNAGFKL